MTKWKKRDFDVCFDCKYLKFSWDYFSCGPEWICVYPWERESDINDDHLDVCEDQHCPECKGLFKIDRCYTESPFRERIPRFALCSFKEKRPIKE